MDIKKRVFNFQFSIFRKNSQSSVFSSKRRRGFTLIELLIVMFILGVMIALFVPNIDRTLNGNKLANEVELFKTRLNGVKLMSGSTQQGELTPTTVDSSPVGYYGLMVYSSDETSLPSYKPANYQLVKIAYPSDNTSQKCGIKGSGDFPADCIIEKYNLSAGVSAGLSVIGDSNVSAYIIAYRVPTQQLFIFKKSNNTGGNWSLALAPDFSGFNYLISYPKSSAANKNANITLDSFTGRVNVAYQP